MNYNKLVIFDLDGVLIESKELHYDSLNLSLSKLSPKHIISREEHLSVYDGLTTTNKLELLAHKKGLNRGLFDTIWQEKQKATIDLLLQTSENLLLKSIFRTLSEHGIKIAVASNSIRKSLQISLLKLGILEYIDFYVSNQDVSKAKPFPEMYWKCMTQLNAIPKTTIIIEDSHIGRQAALDSGAQLLPVNTPEDVNEELLKQILSAFDGKYITKVPWRNNKMNVLIPMAGAGSRFAQAGYSFPKPLIEVNRKPMIQVVIENLNIEARYIFLVQKEHYEKYNLKQLLNILTPNCEIVQVDGVTEGAAVTTLLAKEYINNNEPLLIANSDQYVEWNSNECLYSFTTDQIDGGIVTFKSTHPKWSFAKLGEDGFVAEVAEKNPISDNATVGIYYWKHGKDYVKYAEQMIQNNTRVNNEFYVCPVFNEAIKDNKKIKIKEIEKMWGIGTPEDLLYFLNNHKE
jgi:HAD superfamily hydrolase (TIGR01509 family)